MASVAHSPVFPFAMPASMVRGEPLAWMKHHELAEHVSGCVLCQKIAGKLAFALEMAAEAHVEMAAEARNEKRNGPRNGGGCW